MTLSELRKEDYLGLSLHFVLLGLAITLVGGMFYGVGLLDSDATRQLNIARAELNSAQTALDQIEQEESTIAAYIAPYKAIEAGVVSGGDRLDMQETFAQIRARYSLFPIQLNLQQESHYTLPYDPAIAQPGQPVDLLISKIDTTLPLLHENDLANYLDALVAAPTLIVPTKCTVTNSTRERSALLRLGQHLTSACSFLWFKFSVPLAAGAAP
jgi:hypothetical protein